MASSRWDQIEKLYHSALERPESERSAFLEQVCDGDEELRREVMSLLAQADTNGNLLEIPALEVAAKMLKPNQAESMIGKRLGSYEILSAIGAGGMGEVYRAKDTKLGREVAIKVLPRQFALDSDRLARFRREAKLLASLNHPNIATIHGLEEAGGVHFLVMELVSGETLQERVAKKGAVPLDESLEIAKQICEALEHAHEKGIIHRDLKPANVKLTAERKIKVLDFGLAKAFAADSADNALDSNLTTVPPTASPTMPGMILGTAAYMSPEQARGNPVDRRTDIWAFGCVLYELLTGKQAFTGQTITDILGAVMRAEPDWSALPEATPPAIRALLRRCLQKDATKRSRDAAEIRIQIEEAHANNSTVAVPATLKLSAPRRWLMLGAIICLIAVISFMAISSKPPSEPKQISRFTINLPSTQRLLSIPSEAMLAVSPDGSRVVYAAVDEHGMQRLFLRDVDSLESRPLSGSDDANGAPFFSPDGHWIGFFANGLELRKVPVDGGSAVKIGTVNSNHAGRSATWGANDIIVYSSGGSLMQVSAAGGEPRPLHNDGRTQRRPQFLPGGKVLISARYNSASGNTAEIIAERLDTGEQHVILEGGVSPRYLPSGHLVFYRNGTLFAVPFDAESLTTHGTPVPVVEGVRSSTMNTGAEQYSISDTGTLVYIPGVLQIYSRTAVWVDRKGNAQPLPMPVHGYSSPRLSPDGQKFAVTVADPKVDVWVYDIQRETMTRLTFDGGNSYPRWTPDGKRILYVSNRKNLMNLFWKQADGTGEERQITFREHLFRGGSFTPDGKLHFFVEADPKTGKDIWAVSLEGAHKAFPIIQSSFDETNAAISPDGNWLSYVSNESGRLEIYVRPYPGPGGKWQISTDGGDAQVWSRDGNELFYLNGEKMMSVAVTTTPSFSAGTPKLLFDEHFEKQPGPGANYDVSLDGQKFLMLRAAPQLQDMGQINVVLNWFEELKQKVPVK